MKFIFLKTCIITFMGFCIFVYLYHDRQVTHIQTAMAEHAVIVSGAIWDLNPKGIEEYLRAVAAGNNYEKLTIKDTEDHIFFEVNQPLPNIFENKLIYLKLIPRIRFSANIAYRGERLGRIAAIWLDKSIYIYAYAFLLCLLILVVAQLYSRVLNAKNTLEQTVKERTRNLVEKTEELQASERSYRTLAENLPGLVYRLFLSKNQETQFFNNMLKAMTGYQEAELNSERWYSIASGIIAEDRDHTIAVAEKAVREKNPFDVEYRFLNKTGKIRWFHERGRPVYDEQGHPLYMDGVIFDITEAKEALVKQQQLEDQLRQSQKLEALGVLAGGITHDFNNILSSIYGYTQLALMELPDDSAAKNYLQNMYEAAFRARELVKQILIFSRQESQKLSPIEIHIIVKEALKLLRASIPATIEIQQNIPKCGTVLANPTQIHQILMNLCTNAYHAMRATGGILRIFLSTCNIGKGEMINGIAFQPGKYLQLEVSDTGTGMDRQILDRIFEPYFTTKAKGEGTGLGLSVVHGIVKSHGGHIAVTSTPGVGSTFFIYWPLIEPSGIPHAAILETCIMASGKNESILLIDDEPSTLHIEEDILSTLGYQVIAYLDPRAALNKFHDQPEVFDLIITDMTMPLMTGVDLSVEMIAARPDIPIILCTGYNELINEEKAKAMGIRAFVMKPFEIISFSKLIRQILDEQRK